MVQIHRHGHGRWGTPRKIEIRRAPARADPRQAGCASIHQLAQSIRIDSFSTLHALFHKNDTVLAEIENLVKTARVIDQRVNTDGTAHVTMQLSLLGAFSQLILPQEIKQIRHLFYLTQFFSCPHF